MKKCDSCTHKGVCKHEKDMQKFEKEIAEKTKLLEYAEFSAKVDCKHYYHSTPVTRGMFEG